MSSIGSLFGSNANNVPVNTFQAPNMGQTAANTTGNISQMGAMEGDLLAQYLPFMNTQTGANTAGAAAGSTAAQATIPGATNVGTGSIAGGGALQGAGNDLITAGQNVWNTASDPQGDLYAKLFQQNQDQTNVTNAMYGVQQTPYGAGVANQSNTNFNIDWQNQQLQRQLAGLQGFGGAVGAAGTAFGEAQPIANMGQSSLVNTAMLPFATTAAGAGANTQATAGGIQETSSAFQPGIQDLLSYLGWGTNTNAVYNQGQIGGTNATTKQEQQGWSMLGDIANVGGAVAGF